MLHLLTRSIELGNTSNYLVLRNKFKEKLQKTITIYSR